MTHDMRRNHIKSLESGVMRIMILDDDDDLYIIGAVCLSVGHKSDYFQAECVKVSRNRRNHKKCLEIGEILFLPFLDTFQK